MSIVAYLIAVGVVITSVYSQECSFSLQIGPTCSKGNISAGCFESAPTETDMQLAAAYTTFLQRTDFISSFNSFMNVCHYISLKRYTEQSIYHIFALFVRCGNSDHEGFTVLFRIVQRSDHCSSLVFGVVEVNTSCLPFSKDHLEGHLVEGSYFLLKNGLSFVLFVQIDLTPNRYNEVVLHAQQHVNQPIDLKIPKNKTYCYHCKRFLPLLEQTEKCGRQDSLSKSHIDEKPILEFKEKKPSFNTSKNFIFFIGLIAFIVGLMIVVRLISWKLNDVLDNDNSSDNTENRKQQIYWN